MVGQIVSIKEYFVKDLEPVNLFVYGVVGRDYPKYVCCFGRDV